VKLLIDSCVSHRVGAELRAAGHDVDTVTDWPADPGDREILAAAVAAERVLITADRGFGQLALHLRLPSSGIVIVEQGIPAAEHAAACLRAITDYADELIAGAVVIVTRDKMRKRWPPPHA
jgi:predicted nuclease of predicted toxin-antitoxin system